MKKLVLNLAFSVFTLGAMAQDCSDIFISQYVEGTGNNKALGIYNPTMNPINLNNQYRLIRYNNGTSSAAGEANSQAITNLGTHTIPSGTEWVLVIDLVDPNGSGQTAPCDTALQAKADTFLNPVYATCYTLYFNGNDALSIQKTTDGGTTWNYVDIFAVMGDPADVTNNGTGGWGDVYPYDNAMGTAAWTLNHTLIRHRNVKHGVTVNPAVDAFNPSVEWDSLKVNTFDSLGIHNCDCPKAAGVADIDNSIALKIYPNPVTNHQFSISSSEFMQSVVVYNVYGQLVLTRFGNHYDKLWTIDSGNLPAGFYEVKITTMKGKSKVIKLLVQ
ncbi:MAG TPA: T9SS type A sorting domain-containing protein [Bacteroidia bacterium]